MYWRPLNGTEQEDAALLCFEFDAEKFNFVELPDNGVKMLRFLFVLGESLAVFGISRDKRHLKIILEAFDNGGFIGKENTNQEEEPIFKK